VSGLLLNVPRERVLVGRTIEIYGWLALTHWERAAGRLQALVEKRRCYLGALIATPAATTPRWWCMGS
jgi:hypothetical protein